MNVICEKTSELFMVFTRPIMTSLSQFLSLDDIESASFLAGESELQAPRR